MTLSLAASRIWSLVSHALFFFGFGQIDNQFLVIIIHIVNQVAIRIPAVLHNKNNLIKYVVRKSFQCFSSSNSFSRHYSSRQSALDIGACTLDNHYGLYLYICISLINTETRYLIPDQIKIGLKKNIAIIAQFKDISKCAYRQTVQPVLINSDGNNIKCFRLFTVSPLKKVLENCRRVQSLLPFQGPIRKLYKLNPYQDFIHHSVHQNFRNQSHNPYQGQWLSK